jgi:hypothetical protein
VRFGFGVAAVSSPRLEPGLSADATSGCTSRCCCSLCFKGMADEELALADDEAGACFVFERLTESTSPRGSESSLRFEELAPLWVVGW